MVPVGGLRGLGTRAVLLAALLFSLVAAVAGPVAAEDSVVPELKASYAFKAKFSLAKAGETLGTGAVDGVLSLAFREPDQEGLKRVVITLDRLEAPGIPGVGEMAQGFVGQQATLVFDRNGRLVDADLPLPAEMLESFKKGLRSALPPSNPEEAAGEAETPSPGLAVTLPTMLKAIRPGTLASFRLAIPRKDGGPARDEVTAELEFAGPDESGTVYGTLFRLDMDIAGGANAPESVQPPAAAAGPIKGELRARADLRLDNGLLQVFDLETAWSFQGKDGVPADLGLKLTVDLLNPESAGGN